MSSCQSSPSEVDEPKWFESVEKLKEKVITTILRRPSLQAGLQGSGPSLLDRVDYSSCNQKVELLRRSRAHSVDVVDKSKFKNELERLILMNNNGFYTPQCLRLCTTEKLHVNNFCIDEEDCQCESSDMDIFTGHVVLSYMEDHLINRNRLASEWKELCDYQSEYNSKADAHLPTNCRKNRHQNIVPYDQTRVILDADDNVNRADYINAATICDHDPKRPEYIVTQGPLPHTVADFWQMVWENDCAVIINLTSLIEDDVPKCHQYWPVDGCDLYHVYEIHLVSEHIWSEDCIVRSLFVKNVRTSATRTVTQYHYLAWPDHSLPTNPRQFLEFRRRVNKSYKGESSPVVVHCSDGAGRTGTYCLLDLVLNRLSKGAKEVDISATLEHFRDQHPNLVETKEQFEFVLLTIAEEVRRSLKW